MDVYNTFALIDVGVTMNGKGRPPSVLIYSLVLGLPFVGSWLGYTATVAEDGREPITTWLDPMLAGVTLAATLLVQLTLVVVWPHLQSERSKRWIAGGLIAGEWFYVFGEVLSNTITLGEPPQDIGSLFEIAAGIIVLLCAVGLSVLYAFDPEQSVTAGSRAMLSGVAAILFIGLLWWFTHPIDQSQPGAVACIPGNVLYNVFHGPCP